MNTEKLQTLFAEVPLLKQYTETILRSTGASMCFVASVFKSVLTGQDCKVFSDVDWKACAKSGKFKDFTKKLVTANQSFRKENFRLLGELKEILAEFITDKSCFDEEDAKAYVTALEDKYSTSSSVCDGLIELTVLMDSVMGKNESRYKKQISNLQNRILELESSLRSDSEQNNQLSIKGVTDLTDVFYVNKELGKLESGSSVKVELTREWSSQACQ
jgi:hypothetical protein